MDKNPSFTTPKRILSIAGSDSSAGAGIQADLKVISQHGCYGLTAITALTAQNTEGIRAIEPCSPSMLRQQIRAVTEDIGVDAIKIGMLPNSDSIEVVAEVLTGLAGIPVILDPVLCSSSGHKLMESSAIETLISMLFPLVHLVTPNLEELIQFSHGPIKSDKDVESTGNILFLMTQTPLLIKGGNRSSADDCFISEEGVHWYRQKPIQSSNTHGTGCSLSTAIACRCAQGFSLTESIQFAKGFVTQCLNSFQSLSIGKGKGPLLPLPLEEMTPCLF